jgi:predicted transposase/invertase (TIGR01784 family)
VKTDSIFYRLFQAAPGILFELLGQSPDLAQGYQFESVEIKQLAFRLDGVFIPKPDTPDQTVIFLEVQFQHDPVFYHRFMAEIHLYLKLHPKTFDWTAVVIFPRPSAEPRETRLFRNLINSDQMHRIYLNQRPVELDDSVGIGLMRLIVMKQKEAIAQAKNLLNRVQQRSSTDPQFSAILEIIETVIVYKFPKLSREAIEKMLGLSELKQTRVYQDALQEGEQTGVLKGKLEGERSLILRQLTRRIGDVNLELRSQIQSLSLTQLESLGEELLDFSTPNDLVKWLGRNQP